MLIEFVSTRFRNFLSYGNNITTIHYQKGLNLITAKNGFGKSSVLEAFTFSLYGKPYRKIKIDQLINDKNGSKLWTETIFIKGEDKYKVERGLKPNIFKLYRTHKSKEFTKEDELDLKSHKTLIQDELDKIIGVNYALFRQIICLSVLNNKPFLTLEAQEKRDILESIFNIKIFGKMLKTLKKNFSVLQSTLELKERELELVKESLRGLNEQINNFKTAKNNFEENRSRVIETLKRRILDIEKYIDELNVKIITIENNKTESSNNIDKVDKSVLKKRVEETLSEWVQLKSVKDTLTMQLKSPLSFPKLFDDDFVQSITKLDEERNRLYRDLVPLQGINRNLEPKYVEKNLESCNESNKKITELTTRLKIIESDKVNVEAGEGVCEYCKQPISLEHKNDEIKKLDLVKKQTIEQIDSLRKQIKIDVDEYIIKTIKENETKIEKIEQRIEVVDAQIEDLKNKHNKVIVDKLKIELEKNEKKLTESMTVRESQEKKLEAIENIEKEFESLKNQIQLLVVQRENAVSNLKNLQKDLVKEELSTFAMDITPLERDFESKRSNGAVLNNNVKKMRRQVNVNEVIKGILDEDGIKKYFFSRLIPKLNENINTFLDYFELPLNFSFDDTFECIIKESNRDRSYFNFSGGERFRIDLSIVLSFMGLNQMINSFYCNVLFFDELLDTGIDDDGLELVLEKLHDLVEHNGNACYIISQRRLEGSVHIDNILKVKKENGFSKIV